MAEPKENSVEWWHAKINSNLGYSHTPSLTPTQTSATIPSVQQVHINLTINDAGNGKEVKMSAADSLIPMAETYLDAGFNVLLLGLHGTGKTVSIQEIAKDRNLKMKYYSCATLDPFTDLVGVPTPRVHCEDHGEFETRKEHRDLHPDCEQPLLENLKMIRPRDVDEAEIIFFDELNRADPKTLNAVFEIIQFRSINGDKLPKLKACWAAMNPPDENYEVERLDPALVDRFDLYIDIQPKPSVTYMSKHMPLIIAKALKLWWDDHERMIRNGKLDPNIDYISPRRLEKIGLVWMATKSTGSVKASLPAGGTFDKSKLCEHLKAAQARLDAEARGETPAAEEDSSASIGSRPAPQFTYQPSGLRVKEQEVVEFLTKNPTANETHQAVVKAYKQGVGGEELVIRHGRILDALNPAALEGLVNLYPVAKKSQMVQGFARLFRDDPVKARSLTTLHKVLAPFGKNTAGFPATL